MSPASDELSTRRQVGERIRTLRKRRNLSQSMLAEEMGIPIWNANKMISRWEHGEVLPQPKYQAKLCEVLNISHDELFDALIIKTQTLWHVPLPRNPYFTGREADLSRLRSILAPNGEGQTSFPCALSGLGGIGKTQTALEYVYRFRDQYQAVFWVRAEHIDTIAGDFFVIASLLNLPETKESDADRLIRAVQRWFLSHDGWLLVMDNIEDLEGSASLLPIGGQGHLIVTVRTRVTGTVAHGIVLAPLLMQEAILLLLRRAKLLDPHSDITDLSEPLLSQSSKIVEELGRLPLALEQAGAFIESTQCDLASYLEFWEGQRTQLLHEQWSPNPYYNHSVATTWLISYQRLEAENPQAFLLLRVLACLHADVIAEEHLLAIVAYLDEPLASMAKNPLALVIAVSALSRFSLIQRDAPKHVLSIHRLVQDVMWGQMPIGEKTVLCESMAQALLGMYPEEELVTVHLRQGLQAHTERLLLLATHIGLKTSAIAQLFHAAGVYAYQSGSTERGTEYLKQSIAIWRQSAPLEEVRLSSSLNYLGEALDDLNQYEEAEQVFLEALAIRESVLGPDDLDLAGTLNDVAIHFSAIAHYDEAISYHQQALSIREQRLGPEDPLVAQSLDNLGLVLLEKMEYEEAEPLLQRGLAIRLKTRGPLHPDTGYSWNNLGSLYFKVGRYAEAAECCLQALKVRQDWWDDRHPEIAQSMANLGQVLRMQRQFQEATQMAVAAQTMYVDLFGPDHLQVGFAYHIQGRIAFDQEQWQTAKDFFLRSLQIFQLHLPPDHPEVLKYQHFLQETESHLNNMNQ